MLCTMICSAYSAGRWMSDSLYSILLIIQILYDDCTKAIKSEELNSISCKINPRCQYVLKFTFQADECTTCPALRCSFLLYLYALLFKPLTLNYFLCYFLSDCELLQYYLYLPVATGALWLLRTNRVPNIASNVIKMYLK